MIFSSEPTFHLIFFHSKHGYESEYDKRKKTKLNQRAKRETVETVEIGRSVLNPNAAPSSSDRWKNEQSLNVVVD